MGSVAQKIIFAALLLLAGCGSLRQTELTFAGKGVMLRGIEPFTTSVEYYDKTAKAVKVKKAKIQPPVWIVSEEMIEGSAGTGAQK